MTGSTSSAVPPESVPSWHQVLVLAVGTGLVAGLLELAPLLVAWRAGVPVQLSPHALWMIPLADVVLFALAGFFLAGLGMVWPRARSWDVILGALVGLAALALLLVVEVIHDLAMLILAAGIGTQASRMVGGRWAKRWIGWGPGLALAAPVVIGILAGGVFAREGMAERERREGLEMAVDGAPNLLLLILDTVRAESLGLYGRAPSPSPVMDSLARRGVTFDVAVATAPWTLPSHASLFTGRWPGELGVGWDRNLDARAPVLAEVLGRQGYVSGGFVGNLIYTSRQTGLARGFVHYEDRPVSVGQVVVSSSVGRALAFNNRLRALLGYHELLNRKDAATVDSDFLDWLGREEARDPGRPWFAFLNYFDAHEPFFPSAGALDGKRWGGFSHRGGLLLEGNAWKDQKWLLFPEDVALHVEAYEEAISRIDREVGELFRQLDARGELENTVVVLLGDHGEQLGERRLFDHNNSVYLQAVQVPFVIVAPGRVPEDRRVAATVSLRDVTATVLDLLGSREGLPGTSLVGMWSDGGAEGPVPGGPESVPSPAVSWLTLGVPDQPESPILLRGGELHGFIDWPYHYIHNGDGTDEFYDLGADPAGGPNLAADMELRDRLLAMRGRLYELVTGQQVPEEMPVAPAVVW